MSEQIDRLYQEAKAEGGPVVVWAGGDAKSQASAYTTAFEERFPEIGIEATVGLSKYLDVEIDRRLSRGLDVPDVVHLQTLHDFDRWARDGVLERFRPPGIEAVPERYADPDGFWSPLFVFAFAPVVDTGQIPLERAPREYGEFLHPDLKDRIILTYPHDDDAVLYQFTQLIAAEGWEWLDRLLEQNPRWVRGTATPQFLIRQGEGAATFTSAWSLAPTDGSTLRLLLPTHSFFQSWYQVVVLIVQGKEVTPCRPLVGVVAGLLEQRVRHEPSKAVGRGVRERLDPGRRWNACGESSSGSSDRSKVSTRTRSTCDERGDRRWAAEQGAS